MNRMNDLNCLLAEKLVEDIKKDYEASGIAVAIIDKSGKTQYEKFWGVRDLESGKEVNGDTIFGLASVTKSFTAPVSYTHLMRRKVNIIFPEMDMRFTGICHRRPSGEIWRRAYRLLVLIILMCIIPTGSARPIDVYKRQIRQSFPAVSSSVWRSQELWQPIRRSF